MAQIQKSKKCEPPGLLLWINPSAASERMYLFPACPPKWCVGLFYGIPGSQTPAQVDEKQRLPWQAMFLVLQHSPKRSEPILTGSLASR
jgi:hypothetical protein